MAKLCIKITVLVVFLAVLFAAGYELWGETFDTFFNREACIAWFGSQKEVAWAWGIGLLISDIVLPVPASGIMAALGNVYGVIGGAMISTVGSALAGITGYFLARVAGRNATRFLASDQELERFRLFFEQWGGAAIIVSRTLPVLPEVMTILAGFAGMGFPRFLTALLLGTVPTSLLFAYIGHVSRSEPGYGILLAILLPVFAWPVFLKFVFHDRVK